MKKVRSFEDILRELRIRESNNGSMLKTKIVKDQKKTYNRQKVKKDSQDPSFYLWRGGFLLTLFLLKQ